MREIDVDKLSLQALCRRILMALDVRLMEESCLSNIMVIDVKVETKFIIVCAVLYARACMLRYFCIQFNVQSFTFGDSFIVGIIYAFGTA